MKKGIVILVAMAILFIAGCGEQLAVTMLSSPEVFEDSPTEYELRAGLRFDQTEAGAVTNWIPQSLEEQTYGLYVTQKLMDPNGLPLIGQPYVGARMILNSNDRTDGNIILLSGTINKVADIKILTEFQWREDSDDNTDRYKVFVGPLFEF